MATIRLTGPLVPAIFERRLADASLWDDSGSWATDNLSIDLGRVRWVDLATLVQLVTIVDSACQHTIPVRVILPHGPGSDDVLTFLEHLEFISALLAPHIGPGRPDVRKVPELGADSHIALNAQPPVNSSPPSWQSRPHGYPHLFPLRWVSRQMEDQELERWRVFFAETLSEDLEDADHRGLVGPDAQALGNIVFQELVDNVFQHADVAHALVAGMVTRKPFNRRRRFYLPAESRYYAWLRDLRIPIVEIAIADSGVGVYQTLHEAYARFHGLDLAGTPDERAEVAAWAFDRESTRAAQKPGTRGLYRVNRTVVRYLGQSTMRTSGVLVGSDHGGAGHHHPFEVHEGLAPLPGTLLRLLFGRYPRTVPPLRATAVSPPSDAEIAVVPLGPLTDGHLKGRRLKNLQKALATGRHGRLVWAVVVVEGGAADRSSAEQLLSELAPLSHPGTIAVLGLPGGPAFLDAICESVNKRFIDERKGEEAVTEDVWGPVLVIGPGREALWAAVGPEVDKYLEHLLNSPRRRADINLSRPVLTQLSSLSSIIRVHGTQLEAELLMTPDRILTYVETLVRNATDTGRAYEKGPFRTPSLVTTSKWIKPSGLIDAWPTLHLPAAILTAQILNPPGKRHLPSPGVIVVDATSSVEAGTALQSLLGAARTVQIPRESASLLPTNRRLIERSEESAVIYIDVVTSGESARRAIARVLRDGGNPSAVACLVDGRPTPEPIELWGRDIPVFSAVHQDMRWHDQSSPAPEIDPVTLDPIYPREDAALWPAANKLVQPSDAAEPSGIAFAQSLEELILTKECFHFSHVGNPIGRHFTLFLDFSQLMSDALVLEEFHAAIQGWLGQGPNANPHFELWFPPASARGFAPAHDFVHHLRRMFNPAPRLRPLPRGPALFQWRFSAAAPDPVTSLQVVVVDTGSISGNTVMHSLLLAAAAGAERILVCILAAQLPRGEEEFLSSVREMANGYRVTGQPQMPGLFQADISVKFLARIPIQAYLGGNECPVCHQIDRVSHEPVHAELTQHARYLLERLELRQIGQIDIRKRETMGLFGATVKPSQLFDIASLRGLLSQAIGSTAARYMVRDHLVALDSEASADPSPEVLAVVRLLAVEGFWLHKPPLYVKELRDLASNLAARLATFDQAADDDRAAAITLLRTASKRRFAENFSHIFEQVVMLPNRHLVLQLLYGAQTFINRPYTQTEAAMAPLLDALREVERRILQAELRTDADVKSLVTHLRSSAEGKHISHGERPLDAYEAWHHLNYLFSRTLYFHHTQAWKDFARMYPPSREEFESWVKSSQESTEGPAFYWLKWLDTNWRGCQNFLESKVLPYLPPLVPMLRIVDIPESLGEDDANNLAAIVDSFELEPNSLAESRLGHYIRHLIDTRDKPTEASLDTYTKLQAECKWLLDVIFKTGDPIANTGPEPSKLIRLLRSIPTDLRSAATTARDAHSGTGKLIWQRWQVPEAIDVFCLPSVLTATLDQLFENIETHSLDEATPRVDVSVNVHGTEATVLIQNDCTRSNYHDPTKGSRVSHADLQRRLAAFGATLIPAETPPQPWTYSIELRLRRLG